MKLKKHFLLSFFIISACYFTYAQTIPAERITNWNHAGYRGVIPVYDSIKNIIDYGGSGNGLTVNNAPLQNAIAALNGHNGVIYFPSGTFIFTAAIVLRSGLVLKGEGANNTMLQFNLSGANDLITIAGTAATTAIKIISAAFKDQSALLVEDASSLQPGDFIQIRQNDATFLNDIWAAGSVGQIVQIESISGDSVYLKNELRMNYNLSDTPKIRKLNVASGVGIECLKIKRLDATTIGLPRSNIYFYCAANCWLKGIESDSSNFAHVQVTNSTNIEITNCYFHGSFSYDTGNGYGISCEFTSGECLVENNIFKHLRHAMLLQAGANGNVFDYNYSIEPHKSESVPYDLSGDIVFHGNFPYLNLVEGNIVQNIIIDVSHGMNGPGNTLFRNRAESYGIIMSAGSGDNSNIVGNEITGTGFGKGNYIILGNGNLEFGNNKNNVIIPTGTTPLADRSYRYTSIPFWWNIPDTWPPLGIAAVLGSGTVPAKNRYSTGTPTYCLDALPVIYTFTGNGNWDIASNWVNGKIPPAVLYNGSNIVIDPDPAGECALNIPYTINPGVTITVVAGKHFIIDGNLFQAQ